MSTLPVRVDLDQLRRRAKDLLRAAHAGDSAATDRIRAVSDKLTLTAARLAIAREHGFDSWVRLRDEVQARTAGVDEQARAFCEASVRDSTGRAARMLAAQPDLAEDGLAPAVVLGDVERVRAAIEQDPAAVTRPDARTGWTPLHLAASSRWHRLEPRRADGLTDVARLLMDSGAGPTGSAANGWTPLRCAIAGVANPAIVRLLLDRGALPDDHDLYLACFGDDDRESLRLLVDRMANVADTTALAAAISINDLEGVRMLLAAGADPRRPSAADLYGADHVGRPDWPPVHAAISTDCSVELVQLLLAAGAEPNAEGPDGRTPHQLAARRGRADLARLIRQYGGDASASDVDLFVSACLHADRPTAERMLAQQLVRLDLLSNDDRAAVLRAAEQGNGAAIELMLDLGFPIGVRGENGATPLHIAAYSGSVEAARVLLARGADLHARDTTWDSTPLVWAIVGSGERPAHNPNADWVETAQTLLDAGAAIDGITLSPDDPKAPSSEVAQLLRARGVPDETPA
ncbi:MAG TPA: ankyrin repeat domain-containing protein [Jatrophihabitans sp.]|nr:ankyrin repeat domain-containing protein [Jatrophihabitans sp.]